LVQSIVDYRRSWAPYIGGTGQPNGQKIFIASIHWNNEAVLRSHWIPAVLGLVEHFGKENVYVSVQESGSWDDSKGALRELDHSLEQAGVRRKIILDATTHEDEIKKSPADSGWIQTSRSAKELRRIPYLSKLRNLVLEPLHLVLERCSIYCMYPRAISKDPAYLTRSLMSSRLDRRRATPSRYPWR
jgi:hypothetical protein